MTDNTAVSGPEGFEQPVDSTRNLPPLVILDIGMSAEFILDEVVIVPDERKPKEPRFFYRGKLFTNCKCKTTNKEKKVVDASFVKGDEVSIPGSGGLNYTMTGIARKVAKQAAKAEPNWNAMSGFWFRVSRTQDEVMSKGDFKGKPVKTFKVEHAAPKGK